MGTRKTSVEIDEELLEAARKIVETTTVKDTVEEAFREVARVEARRREVEALTSMEELDLADPEVMAGAWLAGQSENTPRTPTSRASTSRTS